MAGRGSMTDAQWTVYQLLRIIRRYKDEMAALRKGLREVEKGVRLTENGLLRSGLETFSHVVKIGWRCETTTLSAEKLIALYRMEQTRLDLRIERLTHQRLLIDELLNALSEDEMRVIRLRWFDGVSWRQVAQRLYMCERNGQRLQRQAIDKMAVRLLALRGASDAAEVDPQSQLGLCPTGSRAVRLKCLESGASPREAFDQTERLGLGLLADPHGLQHLRLDQSAKNLQFRQIGQRDDFEIKVDLDGRL